MSSREAAKHPSSVDPPSHIPANAAMLLCTSSKRRERFSFQKIRTATRSNSNRMDTDLAALRYIRRSQSLTPGVHMSSSSSVCVCVCEAGAGAGRGCSSGSLAWKKRMIMGTSVVTLFLCVYMRTWLWERHRSKVVPDVYLMTWPHPYLTLRAVQAPGKTKNKTKKKIYTEIKFNMWMLKRFQFSFALGTRGV